MSRTRSGGLVEADGPALLVDQKAVLCGRRDRVANWFERLAHQLLVGGARPRRTRSGPRQVAKRVDPRLKVDELLLGEFDSSGAGENAERGPAPGR